MSEFYFHLISWEQIDGLWWKFVYAVLWLTHEIFPNCSTEVWPLIDVKISFFLNISPVKLCGNPKQIATQMLFAFLYKVNIQI